MHSSLLQWTHLKILRANEHHSSFSYFQQCGFVQSFSYFFLVCFFIVLLSTQVAPRIAPEDSRAFSDTTGASASNERRSASTCSASLATQNVRSMEQEASLLGAAASSWHRFLGDESVRRVQSNRILKRMRFRSSCDACFFSYMLDWASAFCVYIHWHV